MLSFKREPDQARSAAAVPTAALHPAQLAAVDGVRGGSGDVHRDVMAGVDHLPIHGGSLRLFVEQVIPNFR